MATRSLQIDAAWKKALLLIAAAALIPAVYYVVRWSVAGSAVQRVDNAELAVYLTGLAPDDPQTHYVASVFLEKSFDPNDIDRAIRELETAASLTPDNYILWLELGRARERSGDPEGGELALRRALELAPNYSRVQWALGNALLRQGRIDEAFTEIRKAVAGDLTFAGPAAAAAWQFFDRDLPRVRAAVGRSNQFDAALATLLAREKRFDEALAIWGELPAAEKRTVLKPAGTALLASVLEAKRFRDAVRLSGEVNEGQEKVGTVSNGGFELAVRPDGAGPFEWQIPAGLQPQIVLSNGQKHGGSNSLILIFNSTDAKDFRPISQTIAVEPGRTYELELFYRSDLKTSAAFKWEVIDAADGKQIAASDPTLPKADWTRSAIRFKTAGQSDGVSIRLMREGCGQVCSVSGNLWFDDFAVREVAG